MRNPQVQRRRRAGTGLEDDDFEEARSIVGNLDAQTTHILRQAGFGAVETILHLRSRDIEISAGGESDHDLAGAVGAAGRRHIEEIGHAVHFALDDGGDILVHRLGVGTVIGVAECRDGGATAGYCSIGRLMSAIVPNSAMNRAMTHATAGLCTK